MEIRQAILAAADHIEANPREFDFQASHAPVAPGCGTPGCALGWIGTFLGMAKKCNSNIYSRVTRDGSGKTYKFYGELNNLVFSWRWIEDPSLCAKALRLYADKHFPIKPTPDWEALATPPEVALA